MKKQSVVLLIIAIVLIDQALKFYVKLNMYAGEEHKILGDWFRIHFVENEGMAWGWKFGGEIGKATLTIFRLVAVVWGTFLLGDFIKKKYHKGFIICAALIYAGALGNLIDSMFYGLLFDSTYNPRNFQNAGVVANLLTGKGYGSFLQGKVVDMLYFPIIQSTYPSWFPFWGGERFEFFSPVFNIADASISCGVIIIFIFQGKYFKKSKKEESSTDNSIQEEQMAKE
ncbi:MAG: lipoprotein signal peptidase [Chitinophagaceae bacterium]|nr:lipoprotein signal peptidase [Chitinophagaceae bacterium]